MRAIGWLAGATAAAVLACGPGEPVAPEGGGSGGGGTGAAPPGPATVKVELVGNGKGHVTSTPRGIDCPGTCSMTIPAGVHVSFEHQANTDSAFIGWGGACSGAGACGFDATNDLTLWANFEQRRPFPGTSSCDGIAAPQNVSMQQFVHRLDGTSFACLSGLGDGNGTLLLARTFNDPNAHGFSADVVTTGNVLVKGQSLGALNAIALFPQPTGFAGAGGPGHLGPRDFLFVGRWDGGGDVLGSVSWSGTGVASAAGPTGTFVVAGDLATKVGGTPQHAAAMFNGSGPFRVRWGPNALASRGEVFGVGVDQMDRALVITNGGAKFGAGAISAQWFESDGSPLTGEFVLLSSFVPGESTWFETTALIGGGLLVRRMDLSFASGKRRASALVMVKSGTASVQPAPDWTVARADSILQPTHGGRAYAVLPLGARAVPCTQRVEVVAPDGTSCGAADYAISAGTCDTFDVTLGLDGTIIQQLPLSMEATEPIRGGRTCTWRWWPGALR